MKQDDLKLVLEALKFCHGGEPCGTAEAIVVVEKALAQPEQEPVAWRTFDGEGGYDYRSYEDNESYADDWNKRNPNHAGWVDKLYTHSQPEQKPVVCCQQYDTCLQPCTPRGEHLVRRKWVGLTDEEIDAIYTGVRAVHHEINSDLFARAIESKLKEVNT